MIDASPLSDEALVEITRSEDQELYAELIQRYDAKLLAYAATFTKDNSEAADIVQLAFIKAFKNLRGFNTQKKFSSWIYRIVHNEAVNSIKRAKYQVPLPEGVDFKSEDDTKLEYERSELKLRVQACLNKIPLKYSEPIRLFYLADKSYSEISDILRLPPGTVAVRIRRAKILIKHLCQKT